MQNTNRISNRLPIKKTIRTARDRDTARQIKHNLIAATIADAKCLPSFALVLEGDALAPDFLDGDLLTVAPDVAPLPGDAVVVVIAGKYGCMRINADRDLWDGKGGFVPKGFYTVEGVVLDRTLRK